MREYILVFLISDLRWVGECILTFLISDIRWCEVGEYIIAFLI